MKLDLKSKSVRDFAKFSKYLILSGDIDPQFWILKKYYKQERLSENTALWHSLIYLTYYHLGSALQAWQSFPEPQKVSLETWRQDLPYMRQRRLFRGKNNTNAITHLNAIVKASKGDLVRWVSGGDWNEARAKIEAAPFCGPWSSYKWCDILKFIHDKPITGPDIGNKGGLTAGPIAGLSSLFKLSWKECAENDKIHLYLYKAMKEEFGVPLDGLDQLESCLCDWQSVIKGRYYVGHDIDRDLEQLLLNNKAATPMFALREKVFDERLLGEKQEFPRWSSVRKKLNSVYKANGVLVNTHPDLEPAKL